MGRGTTRSRADPVGALPSQRGGHPPALPRVTRGRQRGEPGFDLGAAWLQRRRERKPVAVDAPGRLANGTLQQRVESTIECFLDLVEAAKHYRAVKKQWVEYLGEHPNDATNRVEHTPVEAA